MEQLDLCSFSRPEERFNVRQFRYLITQAQALVTVGENRNGRMAGYSVALLHRHPCGPSGRIYSLAVHPDERGCGLGRALLEHTLANLGARGVGPVSLLVRSDNRNAKGLYLSLGFTDRGPLRDAWGRDRPGWRYWRMALERD